MEIIHGLWQRPPHSFLLQELCKWSIVACPWTFGTNKRGWPALFCDQIMYIAIKSFGPITFCFFSVVEPAQQLAIDRGGVQKLEYSCIQLVTARTLTLKDLGMLRNQREKLLGN